MALTSRTASAGSRLKTIPQHTLRTFTASEIGPRGQEKGRIPGPCQVKRRLLGSLCKTLPHDGFQPFTLLGRKQWRAFLGRLSFFLGGRAHVTEALDGKRDIAGLRECFLGQDDPLILRNPVPR